MIAEVESSEVKYGFVVDGEPMTIDELERDDRRVAIEVLDAFLRSLRSYGDKREAMA